MTTNRGLEIYDPPRFMKVSEAIGQLLAIGKDRAAASGGEAEPLIVGSDVKCIGMARIGHESQCIVYGTMSELCEVDFGPPLHSLVIPGDTHEMELEFIEKLYSIEQYKAKIAAEAIAASGAEAAGETAETKVDIDSKSDVKAEADELNIIEESYRKGMKAGMEYGMRAILKEVSKAFTSLETSMTASGAMDSLIDNLIREHSKKK